MTNNPPPSQRQLSSTQRFDWLRLIRSENIGAVTFRELLNFYGSAANALQALPQLVARSSGKRKIKIASHAMIEQELEQAERQGIKIIASGEQGYPVALRHIDAAPPIICLRGDIGVMSQSAIAIVGGRQSSQAGCRFTEILARELGEAGMIVASGLAHGIDASAHRGALETGTIAVFAGGIDIIYPPQNKSLAAEIIDKGGAIISEMPIGYQPKSHDFPRRNRIISGISYGTVVIEAAKRSGSLHTVQFALDQGRLVFAAPASPLNERAYGSNALIRDGKATLIINAQDILNEIRPMLDTLPPPPMEIEETGTAVSFTFPEESERQQLYTLLSHDPAEIDGLVRTSGLPARMVQQILLELDIAGEIERHSGNRVSLV